MENCRNCKSTILIFDANFADGNIISMEDDDDDDDEFSDHEPSALTASTSHNESSAINWFSSFSSNQSPSKGSGVQGSKPFEILRDLLCHHAHLAVFMNYVISNSDPSALVRKISMHFCMKNIHGQ